MIGHQAIGQQPHGVPRHCFSQDPFECSEIAIVLEEGEPGVGTVKRVINESALGSAGVVPWEYRLADRGSGCQQRYLTPLSFVDTFVLCSSDNFVRRVPEKQCRDRNQDPFKSLASANRASPRF